MRRFFGLILTVHLVGAVYVDACNELTRIYDQHKIMSKNELPEEEFENSARRLEGCYWIDDDYVIKGFKFVDLRHLARKKDDLGCNRKFLNNYEELCQNADETEYINIKNYFKNNYEREVERCERTIVHVMERFREEDPDSWMQLTEFYSGIKKDDQLFSELQRSGYDMSQEMMSALGAIWKSKNSNAGDFYRSEAISSVKNACAELKFKIFDEVDVVKRLSKNIEGNLAEYIRYLVLCKSANWAPTPNAEKLIKLNAEKDELFEKIRQVEKDMGLTPSV